MQSGLSLGDFIRDVKEELIAAQDTSGEPFYELEQVQLEVSFALDANAKAGAKLIVVELGGEVKAQQTHKVILNLRPLKKQAPTPGASKSGRPTPRGEGGELPRYE